MSYTRLNPASASATSGLFEPASGITVESQSAKIYGKVCQLDLALKHTAAWTTGTQYNIGKLSSAYRPALNTGGTFHNSGTAVILADNGNAYVRPLGASELSANAEFSARFTYILP